MTSSRLVFVDIDGTLMDHMQRVAPSAVEAVQRARAAGHLVYLCTGRSRREIPTEVYQIGFDGVISAGGGFSEVGMELLASHTMPAETRRDMVEVFEAHNLEYTLQAYDDVYPSRGLIDRVRPMLVNDASRARSVAAAADIARLEHRMVYRGPGPAEGIAKGTFFGTRAGTFARVREALGERFHVLTGTIPYLGDAGGEVSMRGVNKGAAIMELVAHLGWNLQDTIGIGDSYNDLEMLQVCGVGIAMGNADDTVKAYADEVTTPVLEDGLWAAFRAHGLS